MDHKTTNIIALVVTGVWALSFIADIILTSYEPSPYLHAIMMTVAGAAFGGSLLKKTSTTNETTSEDAPK